MKISRKFAAVAVAAAVIASGLTSAQVAQADEITPASLTVTPTTGLKSDAQFIKGFSTATGCPVGYRALSGTFVFQNGARLGNLASARTPSTLLYGSTGLDGNPIAMDDFITSPSPNPFVSNKSLEVAAPTLQAGDFELRVYCFSVATSPNYVTDKWFALPMSITAAGAWKVGPATVTPPTVAPTATSLTALPDQTAKTVALTATVKTPDSSGAVATAATGSVQFTQNGANIGSPVAVANGVATYTTPALADGTYAFTSLFTPTGTVYSGSTSAAANVTFSPVVVVVPPGAQVGTAVIDVTLPSNTGSVSFAGLRDAISLGTATLNGGYFTASGSLSGPSNASPIVITDTRQENSTRWSLTGTVSNFVTTDGKILDGKYLGWTPALVAPGPHAGTAGPAVAPAPATVAGLKAPASVLSTGLVVVGAKTTTVDAALNLIAPSTTQGGFYTSTLTLTLVS